VLPSLPQYAEAFVLLFFLAITVGTLMALRRSRDWSLAAALSEKTSFTAAVAAGNQVAPAVAAALGPAQGPAQANPGGGAAVVAKTEAPAMVGSSSRLIAFLGGMAVLSMFMGFGLYVLWALFNGKSDLDKQLSAAGTYLLYGSALFLPYGANQLKAALRP
jgi:hypothetical protein